ncbi:hypothetical protein SEA_ARCHIS_80 [Gordonia phage Archis]|nr:hypothetical protein SEA_BLINGBLING_74 [Gordonia phage BlingBling]QNJ58485.1 hypothetical protein SEA_ARCHIS_80 [Gordonia phage Archis]
MTDLHQLTVTEIDPIEFEHTRCPETDVCAIWHECNVDGCAAPDDEDEACEGEVRHGLFHKFLDGGWFSRDEPHNCAARWVDEWDFPADVAPGVYSFDLDYEAEGVWVPIDIERVSGEGA